MGGGLGWRVCAKPGEKEVADAVCFYFLEMWMIRDWKAANRGQGSGREIGEKSLMGAGFLWGLMKLF